MEGPKQAPHELVGTAIAGAWQHTVNQAGRVARSLSHSLHTRLQDKAPLSPSWQTSSGQPPAIVQASHSKRNEGHQPMHEQLGSALQQALQHLAPPRPSSLPASTQGAKDQSKQAGLLMQSQPLAAAGPLLASVTAAAPVGTRVWGSTQPGVDMTSPAARKAELGRCTWTLLHMLAAQYPDKPTRQQKRDVRQFIDCLTRIYPCGQCASHFMQIVKRDPPSVGSRQELQAWTCRVHNVVNRSLGKPTFNCDVATARWAPLDCGSDGDDVPVSACDMTVGNKRK